MAFYGQNSEHFYKSFWNETDGAVVNNGYAKEFIGAVSRIFELREHNDINFDAHTSAIIYKVLVDFMVLLRNMNLKNSLEKRNDKIATVIDYFNKNYQNEIQLDDVVRDIFVDKFHFIRIFKAATGYSPYEYLLNLRIDKSKTQLLYTADKVEDIARQVGFNNTSCFINAFKRREGKTPLKYRKAL